MVFFMINLWHHETHRDSSLYKHRDAPLKRTPGRPAEPGRAQGTGDQAVGRGSCGKKHIGGWSSNMSLI